MLWSLVGTGPRRAALGIFYAAVLLPTGLCADDLDSAHFNSSDDDMPELPVMQDSTRTCTMAWCHELSCQATHFSVSVAMLVDYVGRIAPMSFVRLHLWLPYLGPSVLEVSRAVTAAELEQQLSIAGHLPHHVLHIAFDTHSTTLDLLSVPDGPVTWWLVRDGLARELLRPVALWHAPGEQHFLTLNSHGQAFSVSPSQEARMLVRMPQGARATAVDSFSRVTGQMTSHGLILFEVAIGTLTASARGHAGALRRVVAILLLCSTVPVQVTGMQTNWEFAARGPAAAAPWGSRPAEPEVMRVWSFTCECPVDLPYVATPDPARLAAQIRDAGRGMPASGDFAWTTPRVVQDVAHMLHMPSRTVPPFAFWLLHFRAHGHVTAASGSTLDWQVLGLRAAEAFGGNCFSQGHFGVLQGGQLFLYGASLSAPPHGTILHLVRTYVPPRAGPTVWDTPTEPEVVMPFDYDICLSPAGTRAIDLRAAPTTVARQARTDESRPSASNTPELSLGQSLARQIEEVSHGLAVLTMRLESAGILPGEAPPTVEVVEAAPTERAADTSSAKTGAGWPGCACSLGLLLVVGMHSPPGFALALLVLGPCPFGLAQAARADGDDETLSHGPSEPRSPDLPDDFAAPTPRVEPVPTASGSLVLRPSGDAGAHTGLPGQELLPALAPQFPLSAIPEYQHRVSIALHSGPEGCRDAAPFLPAGCPIRVYNPFTERTQCDLLSTRFETAQMFLQSLRDHAARRGWQQIVFVQPQPDAHALHLIPAAAEAELVSVVFAHPQQPQAACVRRILPRDAIGRVSLQGRTGRAVAPYAMQRGRGQHLHLRDGDCIPVRIGPFGPPPPEPARSSAARLSSVWLPILVLGGASITPRQLLPTVGLLLVHAGAMLAVPPASAPRGKPIYGLSHYPWRHQEADRTAQAICDRSECRFTVLCPWTGQHGIYTAPTSTHLETVWQRYRDLLPGWPQQSYQPVWPGPRHDRLALVPCAPSSQCQS